MKPYWFAILGLFLTVQFTSASATDARSELIACGTTLFQFASYRLSQQLNEFDDCQQLNAGIEDRDCSDSIQRTIVDMQQQLLDYIRCTRDIP